MNKAARPSRYSNMAATRYVQCRSTSALAGKITTFEQLKGTRG
jgi:hypothetical protein